MARGKRKTIEEKITDKEELIAALHRRIKAEQEELKTLYHEKKVKDLEGIEQMIRSTGLNETEVTEAINQYLTQRQACAS